MTGSIHFVFCIDTEGQLYESIPECFARLKSLFGIKLEPTEENLRLLQEGRIDLGDNTKPIAMVVSPSVRNWLGTWRDVVENVRASCAAEYRNQLVDDVGRPIVMNWFVCDWSGFDKNPRQKPVGVNLVFDHYWSAFSNRPDSDPLYFHHHATPYSGATHHPCRNWTNSKSHITHISAHLIEYGHFPACVRTPIMAPDIHFFLEQWFPFDLSNTSISADGQPDVMRRRWVDWAGAADDWSLYRPDWRDYRRPGSMRRVIGRCVQAQSRYGNLDAQELEKAFFRARQGDRVLVSCHAHDHSPFESLRDLWSLLNEFRGRYPEVKFFNNTAVEAFRSVQALPTAKPPRISGTLQGSEFHFVSDAKFFGPQPWLAFRSKDGKYHWDNFDIIDVRHWRYIFDEYTCPLDMVDAIGVGANDCAGNSVSVVYDVVNGDIAQRITARTALSEAGS